MYSSFIFFHISTERQNFLGDGNVTIWFFLWGATSAASP